ncbi:MAG: type II secretion system protein [Bacilli bacterium]|nr:type II secretion system protein [Bacilli bacterium]
MKRLNNKGFTLVELIAVLVILISVMMVTIPAVNSSLEKNKDKQLESTKKLLENASEFYVTNNKDRIDFDNTSCYIDINDLVYEQYVDKDAIKNPDGEILEGNVVFYISDYSFRYQDSVDGISKC